jgi:hypothetical protein
LWGLVCFFEASAKATAEARVRSNSVRRHLGGRWHGWARGARCKSRSAARPSRWRLCVRTHARQCLASNAPSPL